MYTLTDTFNNRVISRHRTARAAVEAKQKHERDVRKGHGASSYMTYEITHSSGKDISEEIVDAVSDIYHSRP